MAKKIVKKVIRRVRKSKTATSTTNAAVVQTNTTVASVPEVVPEVVATTTVTTTDTTVPASTTEEWEETWSVLSQQTSELVKTARTLNTTLKKVHRQWTRALKDARKQSRRRKTSTTKRLPSGFAKPSPISTELCNFLGKPDGTEMARTEVTRLLTVYIKEHSLQDPSNKRIIVPDERLTSLLQVDANAELTYFNLQKYMKRHFPKSNATLAAEAALAATAQ